MRDWTDNKGFAEVPLPTQSLRQFFINSQNLQKNLL